ncbi:MAG: hypothetical protein H7338_21245 [Candidatus Sericytochromatia bacterium]|nr:hypothetical protein [Candidatus Sericytochromatia bacterium]
MGRCCLGRLGLAGLAAVIAACSAPPLAPTVVPPILGRYEAPASCRTAAPIDDRVGELQTGGTVSLIDTRVPGDPLDDVIVATGVTTAGTPNFNLTFSTALSPGYYTLEIYKFRPSGAAPLSLRTTVRFDGTAWKSSTPPDGSGRMTVNALTTAMSALTTYDSAVTQSDLIERLAADGTLPVGLTPIGSFDRATIGRMATGIQTALITGTDPVGGMVMLDRLNAATAPGTAPAAYEVTPGVTTLGLIGAGLDPSGVGTNRVVFGPVGTATTTGRQILPTGITAGAMGGTRQSLAATIPADLAAGDYGLGVSRGGAQSNRLPIRVQGSQALLAKVGGDTGCIVTNGADTYVVFVGDTVLSPGVHVAQLAYNAGTGVYGLPGDVVIDPDAAATNVSAIVSGGSLNVLACPNLTTVKTYSRPLAGSTWTTTSLATGGVQVKSPVLRISVAGVLYGGWIDNGRVIVTRWPNPVAAKVDIGVTGATRLDLVVTDKLQCGWIGGGTNALKLTPYTFGFPADPTQTLSSAGQSCSSLSMARTATNGIALAYTAEVIAANSAGRAFYGLADGTQPMVADTIYEAPLAQSSRVSLGIRDDGLPTVTWAEGNIHYLLHYAVRNPASVSFGLDKWSAPLALSNGEPLWASLAQGPGRQHLMWMDEHGGQMFYLPLVWR